MTNEETIKGLKAIKTVHNGNYAEHIDMAIKALEQQPCDDCISRKAVIRLVEQYPNIIGNRCSGLIADIKHLPSVTPTITDVENNYNIGYNCGYADAMCDIAESEVKADDE